MPTAANGYGSTARQERLTDTEVPLEQKIMSDHESSNVSIRKNRRHRLPDRRRRYAVVVITSLLFHRLLVHIVVMDVIVVIVP